MSPSQVVTESIYHSMFDKKVPILHDHAYDSENYFPLLNAITKDQYYNVFDIDTKELKYMIKGLGAQENAMTSSWRECNLSMGEPFVYPLSVSYTNVEWEDWWNYIIDIPKKSKELIASNRGKILLHNVWEGWPPEMFSRIMAAIIKRYPKYNFTPNHFIVACSNSKIKEYPNKIPHFVQTQLYSLYPYRENREFFHEPKIGEPVKSGDILDKNTYNDVVVNIKNLVPRPHHFIALNRICKSHRLATFTELYADKQMGILSNMMFEYTIDYPSTIRGSLDTSEYIDFMQKLLQKNDSSLEPVFRDFRKYYPVIYARFEESGYRKKCVRMLDNDCSPFFNPNPDPHMGKFLQSSLNIVTETYAVNRDVTFLTEKTFKPILYMQPFVVIGTVGILEYLKSLGFETFGCWIDESYDGIENDEERLLSAINSAKRFYKRHPHDIAVDLRDMLEVLIHNRQTYINNYNTYYTNICTSLAVNLNYCDRFYDQ